MIYQICLLDSFFFLHIPRTTFQSVAMIYNKCALRCFVPLRGHFKRVDQDLTVFVSQLGEW